MDGHDPDLSVRGSREDAILREFHHGIHGHRMALYSILLVSEVAPAEDGKGTCLSSTYDLGALLHDSNREEFVVLEVGHGDEPLLPALADIVHGQSTIARYGAEARSIRAHGQVCNKVIVLAPTHGCLCCASIEDAKATVVVTHCESFFAGQDQDRIAGSLQLATPDTGSRFHVAERRKLVCRSRR